MEDHRTRRILEVSILCIVAIFVLVYVFFITPPNNFPSGTIFTVEEGIGLDQLGQGLKSRDIIRSPLWFRISAISVGGERGMKAGDYFFEKSESVFVVAYRIARAKHDIETVKITIPEGFTNKQISDLFDSRFLKFDHQEFLSLAPQGYLFPDTYFVEVGATASLVIKLLRNNFESKIIKLELEIKKSGHSLEEIINMASIIELEIGTDKDRGLVSDILWKRFEIGMALQVDSAMETYKLRGFPREPISNPGLEAIVAAIHPTPSPYWYFLNDKKGTAYYGRTFDEHQTNRELYLNK